MLSKGIRVYCHYRDTVVRHSFNFSEGMRFLPSWFPILAVGSEEGAMTVHYKLGGF